ncbi:hypothetical protein FEM48_Zijuj01G0183500 [Ziziphus jujuba var. spinosa]|uniref:Uncharacterized protein n=1 Tax=Ziziphus jujuba var. spinosa TaxID=714518 RepID=A0A978W2U6_ZIZJJ|nr:hypothetical protein FEM48_Zijuj01G0183500 [Ziziphus jujuba var. spinosa]
MSSLIDVHAHIDDLGRTEWEGFPSGTLSGCCWYANVTFRKYKKILFCLTFFSLISCLLNPKSHKLASFFSHSLPLYTVRLLSCGTTAHRHALTFIITFVSTCGIITLVDMPLKSLPTTISRESMELKVSGEVLFQFNKFTLEDLLNAGVLGLNSFMHPPGINDFPVTNTSHINIFLLDLGHEEGDDDARSYSTYLKTRSLVSRLVLQFVPYLREAKDGGDSVTVETCPHYLAFSAEEIRDGDTRFKGSPHIHVCAVYSSSNVVIREEILSNSGIISFMVGVKDLPGLLDKNHG